MENIKYFGEVDNTKWGVYQIQCLSCLHEWVAVAPLYTEFECNHCGSDNLVFDTVDNRLCSPPPHNDIVDN